MNPSAEHPLHGISIPAQPHIIKEIKEAGEDIGKISNLISQDPSIAANVLKIVNSAAFGFKSKVASIDRAVMLLGFKRVQALIKSQVFRASLTGLEVKEITTFWESASDVAMICYLLANELRSRGVDCDDAYTVGLLHNCGIIVMAQKYENYLLTIRQIYEVHKGSDLTSLEDIRYQCNHAVVGYYIAKSWQLPLHLAKVILYHHDLDYIKQGLQAGNKDTFLMLAVLKIAEHLACLHESLGHAKHDYEWEVVTEACLGALKLTEYEFERLSLTVQDKLAVS